MLYPYNSLSPVKESFSTALFSNGSSPDLDGVKKIYDWLIGSWNIKAVDYSADTGRCEQDAECIFSSVLEGRAIHDIWIIPKRAIRYPGMPKKNNRYGVTLRWYDAGIGKWKISWMSPVSGAFNQLTAEVIGNDIVQTGNDANGNLIRWSFTEIKPDSFHWLGENSDDNGVTWILNTEFFAIRKK